MFHTLECENVSYNVHAFMYPSALHDVKKCENDWIKQSKPLLNWTKLLSLHCIPILWTTLLLDQFQTLMVVVVKSIKEVIENIILIK